MSAALASLLTALLIAGQTAADAPETATELTFAGNIRAMEDDQLAIPGAEVILLRMPTAAPEQAETDAAKPERDELARYRNRPKEGPDAEITATAEVDGDGRFSLTVVGEPEKHVVVVRAPGRQPIHFPAFTDSADDVLLQLDPGARLHGRVTSALDEPIAGAQVAPVHNRKDVERLPKTLREVLAPPAVTDDDGRWSSDGLTPGTYTVRATADGWHRSVQADLTVRAGGVRRVDATLAPAAAVHGAVHDPAGKPIVEARIQFEASERVGAPDPARRRRWRQRGRPPTGLTDADGQFVVEELDPITAGKLHVWHPDYVRRELAVTTGPQGHVETIEVVLGRGTTVAGTVYDERDQPVAGAVVFLASVAELDEAAAEARRRGRPARPPHPRNRRSDEGPRLTGDDGQFTLDRAATGPQRVFVWAYGKTRETGLELDLHAGEPATDLEVRVELGDALTGVVVDPAGAPIVDARISAYVMHDRVPDQVTAKTDADGRFEVRGLSGDNCMISAYRKGYTSDRREGVSTTARDLRFTLEPLGTITGRVTLADGGTPDQINLHLVPAVVDPESSRLGHMPEQPVETGTEDGRYRHDEATPGTWNVRVSAPGYPTVTVEAVAVRAGVTTGGVDAVLVRGGTIAGRVVRASDGTAVAGAVVSIGAEGPLARMSRMPVPDDGGVVTGADGRFRLEGVPVGRSTVRVAHPDYPERVVDGVEVASADVPTELELELGSGGAIEGRVTDAAGNGVAGARLTVLVRSYGRPREGTTDDRGFYRIAGLPPGSRGVSLSIRDDKGVRTSRSATAMVEEGVTTRLDFAAIGATVVGRVLRAGEPIGFASISLTDISDGADGIARPRSIRTETDEAGNYRLDGVPPATYSARVGKRSETGMGGASASFPGIVVPEAERFEYDFHLTSFTVTGMVVDADSGEPVQQAMLILRRPTDAPASPSREFAWGASDPSGRFEVSLTAPGAYRVQVQHSAYPPQEALEVEVEEGVPTPPLRVELVAGETLRGRVVDAGGSPIVGAQIQVYKPGERLAGFPNPSDDDGRFAVSLPPDTPATLIVVSDRRAPVVLRDVMPGGDEITITATAGGSLDVELSSGGPHTGGNFMLLDTRGLDLLKLPWRNTAESLRQLYTTGRATFEHLPAGTYTASFRALEDDEPLTATAAVVEGAVTSLVLGLQP